MIAGRFKRTQITMKNRFLSLLILISFVCLPAFAQSEDLNDVSKLLINQNNVKAQTTFDYDYINGKPAKKGTRSLSVKFDSRGNKIEEIGYKQNGSVHYVQTYSYDNASRMTDYSKYIGNRETLEYKIAIKYDGRGNKLIETGFNGTEAFRNTYTYDGRGNLTEIIYYVGSRVDEKRKLTHHESNVEISVQNGGGVQLYRLVDTYDKKNLVQELQFDNKGNITRKMVYKYDAKGNQILEEKYMNGKQVYKIDRDFDARGLLSEVYQENNGGTRFLSNKYKYDAKGRITEEQYRSEGARDFSKNVYRYQNNGLRETVDSYFASYKYQVLYVYAYETY
jgi:YD repeat-containing protein